MILPKSSELSDALRRLARAAGDLIMTYYDRPIVARAKPDASPVTDADEAAERLIVEGLRELAPDIPIVAEEMFAAGQSPEVGEGPFWLVDPLDGTKEFIGRNGEFTVNIALIVDGEPVEGVVLAPALPVIYFTRHGVAYMAEGDEAPRAIRVGGGGDDGSSSSSSSVVAVVSRSHYSPETGDFLKDYDIAQQRAAGSSLKFGLIACGAATLYPRLGRTMEWDTAAGDAVVRAAGGSVRTLDGAPLRYGKPGFENPHFIVRGAE